MSLWPFSKNKRDQPRYTTTEVRSDDDVWINDDYIDDEYSADYGEYDEEYDGEDSYGDVFDYDAEDGDVGPFDGDTVPFEEFDFSDFSRGTLDLGSLKIPLPRHSEVQVEMDSNGPRMLHIVTPYGRITPVAFAAPRSEGQWRQTTKELAEGMRNDGLIVHIEHGPWGREIVGIAPEATIRIIGADGPRWMLRMTIAAPTASADEMTELGRDVVARTFVYRGEEPIFAGQPLPVALPDKLAQQVQQAMEKRSKPHNAAEEKPAEDISPQPSPATASSPQPQQPAPAPVPPTAAEPVANTPLRHEHQASASVEEAAPVDRRPAPVPSTDATQVMPRQPLDPLDPSTPIHTFADFPEPEPRPRQERHPQQDRRPQQRTRHAARPAPTATPVDAPVAPAATHAPRSQGGKRRAKPGGSTPATATYDRGARPNRGRHALGNSVVTAAPEAVKPEVRAPEPSAPVPATAAPESVAEPAPVVMPTPPNSSSSRIGAEGSALQQMRSEH